MEKFIKLLFKILRPILFYVSMPLCTRFQYYCLKYMGVKFGMIPPRYISAKIWFDGANYNLISIGNGVTISSNVRILTHDWALDTILDGMLPSINPKSIARPIGRHQKVQIGDHSFIGTHVVIMPGATIGKCCIIGAGSVVRGRIPDYSIVIGNPSQILPKSSKDYLEDYLD